MNKVSIIIPIFNQKRMLVDAVNSIQKYTDTNNYRIIFIDNGSSEKGLSEYLKTVKNSMVIRSETNLGFAPAVNLGLRMIDNEHILLLNTDVLVTVDWLKLLLLGLTKYDSIGMVGPYTSWAGKAQTLLNMRGLSRSEINIVAKKLSIENKGKIRNTTYPNILTGFCLLIKNEVFKKVGFLDDSLQIYDDDDYYRRVLLQGYRCCIVEDAFVFHYGQKTFNSLKSLDYDKMFYDTCVRADERWKSLGYDQQSFTELNLKINEEYSDEV